MRSGQRRETNGKIPFQSPSFQGVIVRMWFALRGHRQ
jgi:hypothetical protein